MLKSLEIENMTDKLKTVVLRVCDGGFSEQQLDSMRRSRIFRAYAGNESPPFAVHFVSAGVLSGEAAAFHGVFSGVDRTPRKSAQYENHRTQQVACKTEKAGAALLPEEKTGLYGLQRLFGFLPLQSDLRRFQ